MSLKSFFLPLNFDPEFKEGEIIEAGCELYNHMVKSLRMRSGDMLRLLDGGGLVSKARIKDIDRENKKVLLKLLSVDKAGGEPQTKIFIAQALGKKDKIEHVWQKATEIGATGFFPVSTQHTVVELNSQKEKKRLKRWQKIIREAARQSERGKIPVLNSVLQLENLQSKFANFDSVLIASAREADYSISGLGQKGRLQTGDDILVLVGPEGGFSDREIRQISQTENSFDISLGPRILRTETAGPLITGLILHEMGEME